VTGNRQSIDIARRVADRAIDVHVLRDEQSIVE